MNYFISKIGRSFPCKELKKRPEFVIKKNLIGSIYDGKSKYEFYSNGKDKVLKVTHRCGPVTKERVTIEYYLLNQIGETVSL